MGIGGNNSAINYFDNSNGASYQNWLGTPLAPNTPAGGCGGSLAVDQNYSACYANGFAGPGNYLLGGPQLNALSYIGSRDVVLNLHIGIQHHNDGGRDDVQLLWDSSSLMNSFYNSTNDQGGPTYLANTNLGVPVYLDGLQANGCQTGSLYSAGSCTVSTYLFPNTASQRTAFSNIPFAARDSTWNNQQIIKAQYQKNFGSTAYLRVYGYTYYSDWLQNGPQGAYADYAACCSADYELSSHTRGIAAEYSQQFSDSNLVNVQASYVTASTLRDNNTQMFNTGGTRSRGLVAVNSARSAQRHLLPGTGTTGTPNTL